MNIVKCPNPSCPFQFDAALVPPGAVIACPQCRLQFQLPQASPPLAPAAEPEELNTDPEPEDTRPTRTRGAAKRAGTSRRRDRDDDDAPPRRGSIAPLIALMAVGLVFVCGGGLVGLLYVAGVFQKKAANTSPYTYPDYSLSFQGPGEGWQEDKETQGIWKVRLACFKSVSPEGYIAVQVMKTEGAANKGDLLPAVKAQIGDPNNGPFDDVDEELPKTDAKLLGTAAERYEFQGLYKPSKTGCRGEVYAVAVRNIKVWVYCWAARDHFDELAPAFQKFRDGMRLEAPSGEVKVQRQKTEFRTNAGFYTLTDTDGIWKKQADPTRQDAAADLWLAGYRRVPTTGQLEPKPNANLVVAILDPQGEAKAQAQAHIIAQDTDGGVVQEQAGDPVGEPPADGPVAASDDVVRFTKKYPNTTGSADKMIVFKVIDAGGKRVVAYAWSDLK
nr:hypothetical protein [Fimbriiglobus sp.]